MASSDARRLASDGGASLRRARGGAAGAGERGPSHERRLRADQHGARRRRCTRWSGSAKGRPSAHAPAPRAKLLLAGRQRSATTRASTRPGGAALSADEAAIGVWMVRDRATLASLLTRCELLAAMPAAAGARTLIKTSDEAYRSTDNKTCPRRVGLGAGRAALRRPSTPGDASRAAERLEPGTEPPQRAPGTWPCTTPSGRADLAARDRTMARHTPLLKRCAAWRASSTRALPEAWTTPVDGRRA